MDRVYHYCNHVSMFLYSVLLGSIACASYKNRAYAFDFFLQPISRTCMPLASSAYLRIFRAATPKHMHCLLLHQQVDGIRQRERAQH
jgi:hypothetical protein